MLIASAKNNCIHIFDCAVVTKNHSITTGAVLKKRALFNAFRPSESGGLPLTLRHSFAVGHDDSLGTVLVQEGANVFGRVTAPNHDHRLSLVGFRDTQVSRVNRAAAEFVKPLELRNVRRRQMSVCDDHIIKRFGKFF